MAKINDFLFFYIVILHFYLSIFIVRLEYPYLSNNSLTKYSKSSHDIVAKLKPAIVILLTSWLSINLESSLFIFKYGITG